MSYRAIWQLASTQLRLGLSVVMDSPLSRRDHLDRLREIAEASGGGVVVVECKPTDEDEWRRRLERRDEATWHKPSTWREMERLFESYDGLWRWGGAEGGGGYYGGYRGSGAGIPCGRFYQNSLWFLVIARHVAANNVFGLRAGLCAAKLLYGFNSLQLEGDSN
ncbi:hypothetical protein ACLB2K_058696 [Fragaria x ananassa]